MRRYLRLFLSDKRVIDIPAPIRYLLLYLIILPFRGKRSAKAYQAIWTKQGSPLRVISNQLTKKLQQSLKKTHQVSLGMRYGSPSLQQALSTLSHCDEITILPLLEDAYCGYSGSIVISSQCESVDRACCKLGLP